MSSDLTNADSPVEKPPQGRNELEIAKFAKNSDGDVIIRVADDDSLAVLQGILSAVGGSVNVTRTIYNIPLGPVNTEQSQSLPSNTKGILIKTRGQSVLKLAFSSGDSGVNFVTIPKGGVYHEEFQSSSVTVYFQSPQTSDVVEIIAYS